MGKAKQNIAQLIAFVISAIHFVNLEPPLSIATRLSSPKKLSPSLHLKTKVCWYSCIKEMQN
jgi:hypothetical protein